MINKDVFSRYFRGTELQQSVDQFHTATREKMYTVGQFRADVQLGSVTTSHMKITVADVVGDGLLGRDFLMAVNAWVGLKWGKIHMKIGDRTEICQLKPEELRSMTSEARESDEEEACLPLTVYPVNNVIIAPTSKILAPGEADSTEGDLIVPDKNCTEIPDTAKIPENAVIVSWRGARDRSTTRMHPGPARDHNDEARLLAGHRERENIKACDDKPTRRKVVSESGKQLLTALLTGRVITAGENSTKSYVPGEREQSVRENDNDSTVNERPAQPGIALNPSPIGVSSLQVSAPIASQPGSSTTVPEKKSTTVNSAVPKTYGAEPMSGDDSSGTQDGIPSNMRKKRRRGTHTGKSRGHSSPATHPPRKVPSKVPVVTVTISQEQSDRLP
eukprot:GHVU01093450.1.p1 GENE.GHVU01093450.1~~GHVU01093450.1.p1  ORF type:complete len:417 (+),score=22.02 GHVU01093450.1:87-1253(+)